MTDSYCLWCHRKLKTDDILTSMFWHDDVLCTSCRQKMKQFPMKIRCADLTIRSLYVYEGLTREMLLQYKEMGDEALYSAFLYPYIKELRKRFRNKALISIPSSSKRNKERGFRHVETVYSLLDMPIYGILSKKDDIDQKERTFKERQTIGEHLELNMQEIPCNTAVLLDDIITSGETMKAAHELIRNHFSKVEGFTIACNKSYIQSNPLLNLVYKLN